MGCDIHMFVEQFQRGKWVAKQPNDHGWKSEKFEWPISRNYRLFSFLADVRSHDESPKALSDAKGLPPNPSAGVAKAAKYWEGDAHSHSWFDVAELREACPDERALWVTELTHLLWEIQTRFKGQRTRIVFWFDN